MTALRARMDFVRYANCWEDPALLRAGIAPEPTERILSIASSGDNALSLLAGGAGEVVAFDLNPAQLACLELRIACLRHLEHARILDFLGVLQAPEDVDRRDMDRRLETWRSLRTEVPGTTRDYWDAHPESIALGVAHAGRFENYFRIFRRRVLVLVQSRGNVEALLQPKSRDERERFHDGHWDGWRWRALFGIFFSRWAMGRLGRDPSFFDHVEGSVARRIRRRTRHALVELSTHDNPWLAYILEGSFRRALPPWLEPGAVEVLRGRLDRIRRHLGDLGSVAGSGPFQGANLSDIFEYMDLETTRRSARILAGCLSEGARIAYWNLLAPRSLAGALPSGFRANPALADELHRADRAWFYGRFHLDIREDRS